MPITTQEPTAAPPEAQPYIERADELAAVLSCLLDSWEARLDSDRMKIIRNIRRSLIDMAGP